jgi:hypothetical protein
MRLGSWTVDPHGITSAFPEGSRRRPEGPSAPRLKERSGGDQLVLGSGELAQTLMRDDLVDEY